MLRKSEARMTKSEALAGSHSSKSGNPNLGDEIPVRLPNGAVFRYFGASLIGFFIVRNKFVSSLYMGSQTL
jgi:hypothetical protein